MGKESAAGPEIKKVFWDGDEKGRRFPVAWKRTWVRGSGDALGFDVAVRIEYELQVHDIAEFPEVSTWQEKLDRPGWPEQLKRGDGRAPLDKNPLIDASMGGPPTQFTVGSGVIEGLSDLVSRMKLGEEIEAWLHPQKAYHNVGNGAIPGGALLHFVSLKVIGNDAAKSGWFCSQGAVAKVSAAKGPVRLYEKSLLYPSAEFTKDDLADDLVLNISGEDTPRPGVDRKHLELHDKMFGAAEASEHRFRRRRDAIEKSQREGSLKIVERAHGILRDAQYKAWSDLGKVEKRHAKQHKWTKQTWEVARKVGKAEAEATLIQKQAGSNGRWKVDPTVASLMGREIVQTMNKHADRVARDFQLFGSDQRFKSPYSDSVTELPAYNASIFSQRYWHGINPCSADICLLAASYLPCCRVHMFGQSGDLEGRMRSCTCCGLDMLLDSKLPCTYHRCCVPYTSCSRPCLQDPHPNPRCLCRNPLDLLHMAKQGETDDEGRMGEIRNHALNFGTAKAKGEADSEARAFMSRQLVLLSLMAQGLCVYVVFVVLGGGEWRLPAIAAGITGLPEAHDQSLWFVIGFWVILGSVAARIVILVMYYNPFLEPALWHRRPPDEIEEIWASFIKSLDDDAKEAFVRDSLRKDARVHAPGDSDFDLDPASAGLKEVDRLKLEGNWFIEWLNQAEEAEKPLRAFFNFLEKRSDDTPTTSRNRWGAKRSPYTAADFVVHPYTLKVYHRGSKMFDELTQTGTIDELHAGYTFPTDPAVRAWMAGSTFLTRKSQHNGDPDQRVRTNLAKILNQLVGLDCAEDEVLPCSLLWYVAHTSVKVKLMWTSLDEYLDHKWSDMCLMTTTLERNSGPHRFTRRAHPGCCGSGFDQAPPWKLLLDRRGEVYWNQVSWADDDEQHVHNGVFEPPHDGATEHSFQHVPNTAVEPLRNVAVGPTKKRELEFGRVMQRFLSTGGAGAGEHKRVELSAHRYIQLRYQVHDTEAEEDHASLVPADTFVDNYVERLAKKAYAYSNSKRPTTDAHFLTDFAEFRVLERWLKSYWGCTNLHETVGRPPSTARHSQIPRWDLWFRRDDGARGVFGSVEGSKRLELCRKALLFLHVQRTDRKFFDSEGRNVHEVTPPTRGDASLHTLKQLKKALAKDLVRAEEDYRAIEDLFKRYRMRREYWAQFLRKCNCGGEDEDFPTEFPEFPERLLPKEPESYPPDKLVKKWTAWTTKYKEKPPSKRTVIGLAMALSESDFDKKTEFKSPENLQLIYDIAFGEDRAIAALNVTTNEGGATAAMVEKLKGDAKTAEKEVRMMIGGVEDADDEATEQAITLLKKAVEDSSAADLQKVVNQQDSIPKREFAAAWAAFAAATGNKRSLDEQGGIRKVKAERFELIKLIRQESPEFQSKSSKTFKKNIARLWQVELEIAEHEIPHFCLDADRLATVSQSTTKSSRDVVWDTLEAAIEDLDAFKDYCEATKAAGKGSRLKKQQKQAKSNLANKDKERKSLEEARKYAKMKLSFKAVCVFTDTCGVFAKSIAPKADNPASRCLQLLDDDRYVEILLGDGADGPAWLTESKDAAFPSSEETLFDKVDDMFPKVMLPEEVPNATDPMAAPQPPGRVQYSMLEDWSSPFASSNDMSVSWEDNLRASFEAAQTAWHDALFLGAWHGTNAARTWTSIGGVKTDPLVCVSLLFGAVLKARVTLSANSGPAEAGASGASTRCPFEIARLAAGGTMTELDGKVEAMVKLLRQTEHEGEDLLRDMAQWYKCTDDADLGSPDSLIARLRAFASAVKSVGATAESVAQLKETHKASMKGTTDLLKNAMFKTASGDLVPVTALLPHDVEERLTTTLAECKKLEAKSADLEKQVDHASTATSRGKKVGYVIGPVSKRHRPNGENQDSKQRYRKAAMQVWVCHLAALWQSDPRVQGFGSGAADEETRDRARNTWRKVVKVVNDGDTVRFTDGGADGVSKGDDPKLMEHPGTKIMESVSRRLRAAKAKWFRDDVLEDLLGSWTITATTTEDQSAATRDDGTASVTDDGVTTSPPTTAAAPAAGAAPKPMTSRPTPEANLVEQYFVSSPKFKPPRPYRAPPTTKPSEELALKVMNYLIQHSNGSCKGIMEELTDTDCAALELIKMRGRVLKGYQKTVNAAESKNSARIKLDDPSVRALRDSADFPKVWEFVRCKMAVDGKGVRGATGDPKALSAMLEARKTLLFCEYHALTLENQDRQQVEFNTDVAAETRRAYQSSIVTHEGKWSNFWELFAEQLKVEAPSLAAVTSERLAHAQERQNLLSANDKIDIEADNSVDQGLLHRPGALYEDLIEEYSRASVTFGAVLYVLVGWVSFVVDPAAGLHWLDQARLPPRANQRLEADLALFTLQNARGHAAAELQVTLVCGAILAVMICYYLESGDAINSQAHSAFLFWLTAGLVAAQFWRAFGATTRFLRVQREVMVGDAWARWLGTPADAGDSSSTSSNRWEGASDAVAQAASMKASGAHRFHGDGYDVPLKYSGMFTEDEIVREEAPKIVFDANIHPKSLCRHGRAFEFRGFVPDCHGFIEWDFEIQFEMVKAGTDRRLPDFGHNEFAVRLTQVLSDGLSFDTAPERGWDSALWAKYLHPEKADADEKANRASREADGENGDESTGHSASAPRVPPPLAFSVARDENELNAGSDVTDFVRLKFCVSTMGQSAVWYQRIRYVLQRQMSSMDCTGLQFESKEDENIWFRPRVYRWRERAGASGMTEWRPNIKPIPSLKPTQGS